MKHKSQLLPLPSVTHLTETPSLRGPRKQPASRHRLPLKKGPCTQNHRNRITNTSKGVHTAIVQYIIFTMSDSHMPKIHRNHVNPISCRRHCVRFINQNCSAERARDRRNTRAPNQISLHCLRDHMPKTTITSYLCVSASMPVIMVLL